LLNRKPDLKVGIFSWSNNYGSDETVAKCNNFFKFDLYQKTCTMHRIFSSAIPVVFLLLSLTLVLISGCRKQQYEERIEGVWEVVDVSDIEPGQGEYWEMFNNNIDIFRYSMSDPSNYWLSQQGKYVVERKGTKMFLKLANLNYSTFNTSWEIFKLNEQKLIISIEVSGGIFYKEFVKKIGN
jgi:hypothetical protein